MAGFFVKYNNELMAKLEEIGNTYQSQFASDIMTLATASITLYVMWKGYQTLAGKTQTPLPDLAWDLTKFAIIITFITNGGGYLTAATEALKGLKEGFSGGVSVWQTLDNLWASTQLLAEKIYQKDTDYIPLAGAIGACGVWIGSILLMGFSTLVFISADVVMTLMIIVAPIFIFCLMFGFLRQMFNNWLQTIFSSILTVLFASLVIKFCMDVQGEMLTTMSNMAGRSNVFTVGAMGLMAGVISSILVVLASKIAMSLAGAGVDGAVQGMAAIGVGASGKAAASLGSVGLRSGVGFGMGLAGKKGMQSFAGRAGNTVGRGTRSAAEWTGQKMQGTDAWAGQKIQNGINSMAERRRALIARKRSEAA